MSRCAYQDSTSSFPRFFSRALAAALAIALAMVLPSCDQLPNFSSGKPRVLAEEALASGDYRQAVRYYEAALDGTSNTADVHYRLALLFDGNLKDSVAALHHYRRFLSLSPEEAQTDEIRNSMARLERELATRLGEGGLVSKADAVRLRNENLALRQQLAALRGEKSPPPPPVDAKGFSTIPQTRSAEQAVAKETRTYTVQKGDTLAAISRKFYNTSNRWKDIVDANHNQLQGGTAIREGQILIIP